MGSAVKSAQRLRSMIGMGPETKIRVVLAQTGGLSALFVGGTVAMIHPTIHQFTDALPANLGDSALITWILAWGAHSLTTSPLHYFSANIYWPHGSTLAYSDLLTPLVPIYGPVHALWGSWALAANVTLLVALVFSLAATYALVKWLTGRADAGIVAAFGFTFSGFTLSEWGHLQLQTLGLLSLAALLLGRVLERRSTGTSVALGVVNAAVVLAAVYYGVIWMVSFAVIVVGYWLLRRGHPGRRFVYCIAVSGAVTAAIAGPAAFKYMQLQNTEGHKRGYEPSLALKPRDLMTPANKSYLWSDLDPISGAQIREHGFFPGFSVLSFAGVGSLSAIAGWWRRRRDRGVVSVAREGTDNDADSAIVDPDARHTMVGLLMAAGVTALVLAVGPTVRGHPAPYRFFHDHVPGFAGIRVTARFAVVALLSLAALAGHGWATIVRRLPGHIAAWSLTAIALLAVCLDLAAPLPWAILPRDPKNLAVYRALAHDPPGAVVELPMADPRLLGAGYAYIEAPRMVYSTLDWHPRVNGYSGFAPSTYLGDIDAFATLPDSAAFVHARGLKVRYLILHVGAENGNPAYSESQASRIVDSAPSGAEARRYPGAWLIDLGSNS